VGESVVIINAANPSQFLSIQIALQTESFVYTTCSNDREVEIIRNLSPKVLILDTRKGSISDLSDRKLFDLVLDDGTFSIENAFQCLDVKSKYFTPIPCQLSKEMSHKVHLKSIIIGSYFDQSWVLMPTQSGRFLHILKKIASDVSQGIIKAPLIKEVRFDAIEKHFSEVHKVPFQKLVVKFDE
jgi:hypothetical protein